MKQNADFLNIFRRWGRFPTLREVLEETERMKAAKLLGIHRNSLYDKLRKHQIDLPEDEGEG